MGLQTTIQNAVSGAKTATLDLWSDVTYNSIGNSVYSTATGSVTNSQTDASIKALISGYESEQVDNDIIYVTDKKALVVQSELSVTPDTTDKITISGKIHDIVSVKEDAANATWEIQLRCL